MKLILLAATAMFAAPVMAQTTPAPADTQATTPAPADQAMTPAPADPAAAPADAQTPPPPPPPPGAAPAPQAGMQQPMSTGGATPAGGYQPSGSALTGGTPGANLPPVFRPAPTPDQAYPAPAPQAEYPICKKGQYDGCRQVEGGRKMAKRRARR